MDREEVEADRSKVDDKLIAKVSKLIDQAKVVVISDYGKGAVSPALLKLFADQAKNKTFSLAGRPLVLDPKCVNYEHYHGISVAKPNRREAEKASGIKN